MRSYPLFDAFPRLGVFPRAGLLDGVTAVQPMPGVDGFWIKRDDLSANDFGGNKIRKLDLLLAQACARNRREVLTFGYSGSNFVAATAWHGRKLGLATQAVLLPQADAPYVADNLATALHAGAQLHLAHGSSGAIARAVTLSAANLLRRGRLPTWIPPGGSSPLGAIGFVNAAFELKAQIDAGALPAPAQLYVAFSSMGTVAGLSIGLALAGLGTRIEAVQVVGNEFASSAKLDRLVAGTLRWLRRVDPSACPSRTAAVRIRAEFFGAGYAVASTTVKAAMSRFENTGGARSDSAYSGKAIAAVYADHDAGRLRGPSLYWHTFNAHGRPPGVPALSPEVLARYVLPT